jgi:hypothetical protein
MKKILFLFALSGIVGQALNAQDFTPPAEVINVAYDNFSEFLTSAVTEDTKTMAGFSTGDNLKKAVLGIPFRIFHLSADSIRNYDGKAPLRSIVTETNMWYFPIVIDGTIKVMLYVGKKDGVWMRAGFGSAGLARQIQAITSQWSPSEGFTPIIVQQQNIGAYFYSIPQVNNSNLTETTAIIPKTGLNKRTSQLKPLTTTISSLRSRISR